MITTPEDIFRLEEGAGGPSAPSVRRLNSAAVAYLVALLAFCSALVAPNFTYPYPLGYADAGVLSSAWRIARGEPIYNVVAKAPFVFNIHNPIFIHLSALLLRLFGPSPAGPRLLGEAMLLASAALVFFTVRRLAGSPSAGLIAALFLLVERHVYRVSGFAVSDFSSMFFLAAGIYLWVRGSAWRVAATAAFVLAFFSKQSAFLLPQAVLLSLVIERRWRQWLTFECLWLLLIAAGLAVCWFIWGKAYFLNTFFYGTATSFSTLRGIHAIWIAALFYPAAFSAVGWTAVRAIRARCLTVVPMCAAAGLVNAYLSGNEGSSATYCFDLALALALSLGLFWSHLACLIRDASRRRARILFALLAVQAALMVAALPYAGHWSTDPGRFAARDRLRASLYDAGGMVLASSDGYDLGRPAEIFTTDPHRLGQMLQAGIVRRETLIRLVREKAFSAILAPYRDGFGIFDEDLRRAIRESYLSGGVRFGEEYFTRDLSANPLLKLEFREAGKDTTAGGKRDGIL